MNPDDVKFSKMRPDGTFRMYVKGTDGHETSYRMAIKKPDDFESQLKDFCKRNTSDIPGMMNYKPSQPKPKPKKIKMPLPFSTIEEEVLHRKMLIELLTPEELALPDVERERIFIRKELVHLGALRDLDTIGVDDQFHEEARRRAYRRNKFSAFSWYLLLHGKLTIIFWVLLFIFTSYIYVTSLSFWDSRDPSEVRRELEMKYGR